MSDTDYTDDTNRKKNKLREYFDMHRWLSIFGFMIFLVLSLTGTVLTFRPELQSAAQTHPWVGLIMYLMHILHTHLALGGNSSIGGYMVAGIFSLVATVSIATGLLIYRPYAVSCQTMRERSRETGKLSHRFWMQFLHQELSAMAAVWGILLCFSGAWIAFFFVMIMSGQANPNIAMTANGGMALQSSGGGIGMQLTTFMLAIHLHNHETFLLRVLWAVWMCLLMLAGTTGIWLALKKKWGMGRVAVTRAGTALAASSKAETAPEKAKGWSVWFLPLVWSVLTLGGLIFPLFGFVGNILGAICLIVPFFLLAWDVLHAFR